MPSRFHVLLAFAGVVALLSCGTPQRQVRVVPIRGHMKVSENVNVVAAADTAIFASALRFVGGIHTRPASVVASPHAPTTVLPTTIDWPCIAQAETGSDFTMHGPAYSSAYGLMDEAIRENTTPEIAQRIIEGKGTPAEQLAVAKRIAARFGIQAWAPSTVAQCDR